jgi:plastocyanin
VVGLVVQLLALYVVLAAGTNLLPQRWRFRRYKPWMRSTLALWWLALLLGAATYYVWYVQSSPLAATGTGGGGRTVTLRNYAYHPKALTVPEGTTVIWHDLQGTHTVHADRGFFRSSPLVPDRKFDYTFRQPGIYLYHCDFHGGPGGIGMSGRIVVVSR